MKLITYEIEEKFLSPFATKSLGTCGRLHGNLEEWETRTPFQRDRDRIIHSKSFRRLKNKTQVFVKPTDHIRTRLTHTLDVSQIARTIARLLRLNEDLTEAIALGHDLGHTPFGHAGERTLWKVTNGKFAHHKQSLRVVDVLENDGQGLNLTFEVRDGILNHTSQGNPQTLEGKVVHFADRIAYLNHDLDDAFRCNLITQKDIPNQLLEVLGDTHSARINNMVLAIVNESFGKNFVDMSHSVKKAYDELREFMFKNVYQTPQSKKEEEKTHKVLMEIFSFYMENTEKLPEFYIKMLEKTEREQVITDFVASMTDDYAIKCFSEIFLPSFFKP